MKTTEERFRAALESVSCCSSCASCRRLAFDTLALDREFKKLESNDQAAELRNLVKRKDKPV